MTASYVAGGTFNAIRAGLTIKPTASTSPEGGAQIALIPNDASAFSQDRTAMIQFYPEREYVSDATIKAHRHLDGGGTPNDRHIQIHTKNAAGDNVISRLEIQYKTDDAYVLITSGHLILDTNAYIQGSFNGSTGSNTGAVPIHGVPSITSQGAAVNAQIEMGRTSANDFRILVAGSAGAGSSATSAAGDVVIRQDTAGSRLILQAGNDAGAIIIGGGTAAAQRIGFFNTTPAARPTGVAVTAAGIHAALVTLGLITA